MTTNQFHDYYFHADSLASMNFYDFCRCTKLERLCDRPKNTVETRADVHLRHCLLDPHPLAHTHGIVEFWNDNSIDHQSELVPRFTGCTIPHPNTGLTYAIFVLAHFKPFSASNPLLHTGETFQQVFQTYTLSERAKIAISQWDATNECKDARDAERMRRKAHKTRQSNSLTESLFSSEHDIPFVESSLTPYMTSAVDFDINQHLLTLQQSNWLNTRYRSPSEVSNSDQTIPFTLPPLTGTLLSQWKAYINNQETILAQQHRNNSDPHSQIQNKHHFVPATETGEDTYQSNLKDNIDHHCPDTEISQGETCREKKDIDSESLINRIGTQFNLNKKQWMAFKIIARSFLKIHLEQSSDSEAIRMFITGPGGTGNSLGPYSTDIPIWEPCQ
jgi:hypothetical protein